MSELLSDGETSSVRVVLNPEKMVVKEAQRAYTYLNLYSYSVDAVICNRVFPDHLTDSYFDAWKHAQANNLQLVRECFQPLPIFEVPFFAQEVSGVTMLHQMADAVFGVEAVRGGAGDPTQQYFVGHPQEITVQDGYYVLSIALPLVEREEVSLHRSVFDELVVRIGNWKRNVALPLGLAKLDIAGARFEDDRLNILFVSASDQLVSAEELETTAWESLRARLSDSQV
jgi:arsenite-transporting ATPase